MHTYGQFCPVAKAAEIFAERWTPLIIRELIMGSHHFNELQSGLPRISRALLAGRLRALERAGLVERRTKANHSGRGTEYHLTAAGWELEPIILQLGEWGQRWANNDVRPGDIDPALLMWDMRRRINLDLLPARRVLVQFDFQGARQESWWLVLDRRDVSICLEHPGFDLDLLVTADTVALHRVWVGRMHLADALHSGEVQIDGVPDLAQRFPRWLALSSFAQIPRVVPKPEASALIPATEDI